MSTINQDQTQGQAQGQGATKDLSGKIKQVWGRLSDEDISLFTDGKKDQFFAKLEEKYGIPKNDAEKRLTEMKSSVASTDKAA